MKEMKRSLQDDLREVRERYYHSIAEEVRHSNKSYADIGRIYGVSEQTVYNIARLNGLSRARNSADITSTSEQGGENGES
jgi:hypothetical protein